MLEESPRRASKRWINDRRLVVAGIILAIAVGLAPAHLRQARGDAGGNSATGFSISLSGSDANPCTTARPCRTFDHAYDIVPEGAVVRVAGGSYGDQLLSGRRAGGRPIVFKPNRGAKVSLGELRTEPNSVGNFNVEGMALSDAYLASGTHDVTFRNFSTQLFYLRTTTNISFIDGQVGGVLLSENSRQSEQPHRAGTQYSDRPCSISRPTHRSFGGASTTRGVPLRSGG